MCDRVFMKVGDACKDASTRGELRTLLGVEPIYDDAGWLNRRDWDCLCCCDVPGTAKLAGLGAVYDAGDWELIPETRSLPHQHAGDTALAVGNLIYALARWKASKPGAKDEWPALVNACAEMVAAARPEGIVLVQSPITEEMHQAACKVLARATGLDGTPQRMLDALAAIGKKEQP